MAFLSVNVEASKTSKNTNLFKVRKHHSDNNTRKMFPFLSIAKNSGETREHEKMKVDTEIVKM